MENTWDMSPHRRKMFIDILIVVLYAFNDLILWGRVGGSDFGFTQGRARGETERNLKAPLVCDEGQTVLMPRTFLAEKKSSTTAPPPP